MFASKDIFLKSSGGYQISRSVRLRSSASAYFNRTPVSAGNRKTWTWSGWVKIGKFGVASNPLFGAIISGTSNVTEIAFDASNRLDFFSQNTAGTVIGRRTTTQVFRDPSAWYHIVVAIDTSDATASNRIKLYVNGNQITSFAASTDFALNDNTGVNDTTVQRVGARASGTYFFDGYLTEVNLIDGQALTPSSFGETNALTGVWQPKAYSGTYGTNGFYLNFSDNSGVTATTIGKDYSGNGNNWTPSAGISITAGATYDSMIDVPTPYADGGNGRGNYAVLNPVVPTGAAVISGGNLNIVSTATYCNGLSTINLDSGAYYCECVVTTHSAEGWGVWDITKTAAINTGAGTSSGFYGIYSGGATLVTAGIGGTTNAAGTPANGDIIQVAWSNGNVWLGKNNTWYNSTFGTTGNPSTGANPTFTGLTVGQFAFIFGAGNATVSLSANFGQRPFTYTPPTGFVALNTQNLPTPTISNGASYMAATTYTGTGSALTIANTVGNASFQPDLVWVKGRSGATDHAWYDAVRGVQLQLESNNTAAETTETTGLTAFGSTGFTVGALAQMNTNTATYVAWQWNAGGSTVTNTSGSISAQVRANATAGFSVATFTGTGSAATVGHGLGVAPQMIIAKTRNGVNDWFVYTQARGATKTLYLNLTNAEGTTSAVWNNTAPTSTVFTVGTTFSTNTCVAYCFAAVAGYSAFGSYTGNGSTDGPFVFLGFRPRFVLFKRTDAANDWVIHDSSRNTFNVVDDFLKPNLSNAEGTYATSGHGVDFLSSGMKLKTDSGQLNASTGTYIYAAFAENPFKLSLAR